MAKKKQDPFGGKSYAQQQAEDRTQGRTEADRPDEQRLASFRIGQRLIERIDDEVEARNVKKSDFVKALLTYALGQLDVGEWELPTREPSGPNEIDLDELSGM